MVEKVSQRLVDPELCSACFGCFEVCPKGAVEIRDRRVAVDPTLCELCGDCVTECASGAIDVLRQMPADALHSVEEQLSWDHLPPEDW